MGLDCKGIVGVEALEGIPEELIRQMKEKFPKAHYTIHIHLWDDYTFRVQCIYAEFEGSKRKGILHAWEYYDGEFSYRSEPIERMQGAC